MEVTRKIRVLITDDSAFMRKVLQSILTADPQFEVVGEARDGREAVTQTEALRPDVITMDINMPHVDGLQATEMIMSSNPRPIVIVSSETREGADITLKALELGAIDFVAKPSSGIDLDMNAVRDELTRKLKMASKVRVVRTAVRSKLQSEIANSAPRTEPASAARAAAASAANDMNSISGSGTAAALSYKPAIRASEMVLAPPIGAANARFPLVVVAASTGGPATLMRFVPMFPAGFPGAVLVVQHMPGSFTTQFAQQLSEVCPLKVKEAEQNESIQSGQIYLCPGTHHMRVTSTGRMILDDGPRISGYRPCADVTLETVAAFAGPMSIGVILTGMGNDGSVGAPKMKSAGGYIICQDEATSIIFGMPQEVIKTGSADQVLPLEGIMQAVEKRVMFIHGASKVGAL